MYCHKPGTNMVVGEPETDDGRFNDEKLPLLGMSRVLYRFVMI